MASKNNNAAPVGYLTDVEGNWDYFLNYVSRSSIIEHDSKQNLIFKKDNTVFVYGGDVCDKGIGSIRVTKQLVDFKKKYKNRVILILGNRDINKMRFTSELAQTEMDNVESVPGPYWVKKDPVTPKQFLTKMAEQTKTPYAALNTVANRIKWMLEATMGAAGDFERRREELSVLSSTKKSKSKITDEQVANSYIDSVKNGEMFELLSLGQLAYVHQETLFVHGGVTKENIGYVPFSDKKYSNINEWVNALNAWYKSEFAEWVKRSHWNYPKEKLLLLNWGEKFTPEIQGPPKLEEYEDKSKWQARGAHRLLDYVLPASKGTVVCANMFNRFNDCQQTDNVLRKQLMDHGIYRVITGHQPHGNAPAVTKMDGFEEIDADSSYSDMTAKDNRGKAVSEIVVQGRKVYVRGVLQDDQPIEYELSLDSGEGDQYIGRPVPLPDDKEGNCFWVKAKLAEKPADGKQYLICKVTGFVVKYDYMTKEKLDEIIYNKKVPSTEADVSEVEVKPFKTSITVKKLPHIKESLREIIAVPFFNDWLLKTAKAPDMQLLCAEIQSVDVVGVRIRFIKLRAIIRNSVGGSVSGVVFLRGDSIAVLCVLNVIENGQKFVVAVRHPRSPIGESRHIEIPVGLEDQTSPFGSIRNLLESECGLDLENDMPINLSQYLYGDPNRRIFVSPGSCDQGVRFFLLERPISNVQFQAIRSQLKDKDPSIYSPYETIFIALEDLDRESSDGNAFIAARLYDMYLRKKKEEEQRRVLNLSSSGTSLTSSPSSTPPTSPSPAPDNKLTI